VLQPGGLFRRPLLLTWLGGWAAGGGCLVGAGDGHWLLLVVSALARGRNGRQEEACRIFVPSVRQRRASASYPAQESLSI
jgi:hypothetical protein